MTINSEIFRNQKYYLRDKHLRNSGCFVDGMSKYLQKMKIRVRKVFDSILDTDIETYFFRIIENLPYMFLIFYLGVLSVFTLVKITEKENGIRISTITTSSMKPKITPGSIIISIPKKNYQEGDIISFYEVDKNSSLKTGRVLTHRIIEVNNKGKNPVFSTKGDANEFTDQGDIQTKQILGKVVFVYPLLGYLELLIKTIPGFLIFVVLPVVLLIRNEVIYLKGEKLNLGMLKFGH